MRLRDFVKYIGFHCVYLSRRYIPDPSALGPATKKKKTKKHSQMELPAGELVLHIIRTMKTEAKRIENRKSEMNMVWYQHHHSGHPLPSDSLNVPPYLPGKAQR
jgi:hypothetical protein